MIHVMLRALSATLVLAVTLQASGVDDHDLAETAVPPAPAVSSPIKSGENPRSHPDIPVIAKATDASPASSITPSAPVRAKEPASSPATSGAAGFQESASTRNPWLYIIIGFLLVTGVMLYVDPKLF